MKSKFETVLLSGLTAGTLDIAAAILVYSVILEQTPAVKILQSVASGVFKEKAYTGGPKMAFYGLLFHYIIAFIFAFIYIKVYPYILFLKKHVLLSGILYGIFVWMIMNLIVLPVVFPKLPLKQFDFNLLLSVFILIVCVGFPIAFITNKFYIRQNNIK
ncbi:DUF1440 domain-containing protein [Flavobacterium gelatinilyticum]|uniref:DUF1440 domain-containing protein n=1 Tax=Flavobacterium gelatinilyticum TaxID=3003260 RepID=UPI00248131EC|nr:DUF1440 domain-containing protein [Flavobacterium gelatinilyticum]